MGRREYLNDLEQMILVVTLRLDSDAYGGEVFRELVRLTDRPVGRGAVYIAIDRLVERGLLQTKLGAPEPGRGGRPRRYIAVSEEGLTALRSATRTWLRLWEGVDALRGEP